jgi:hypothetical protein
VFFRKKHRSHERYYLLPGQGGRNYYRKQQRFRRWAIAVGLFFGALLGAAMWLLSRQRF